AEVVDRETFDQILELDDEGTFVFSKEIVSAYFSQAVTTFASMDSAVEEKKLKELSELGHFLKSSSSALGIRDVQAACEKIEQYGDLRGDDAATPISPADALARIRELLPTVKADHATAERWLRKFYADKKVPYDDDPPA
ncbi:histidine phosphotransferase, partial [Mycena pura]